jgi:uncharacterized protein involved in exopolysaccharide biosynthesis
MSDTTPTDVESESTNAQPAAQPIPMGYFVPVDRSDKHEEIDLRQWLQVFAKRKKLIIVTAFTCAFLAAVISLIMTPIYRAEVLLAPAQSTEAPSGLGALVGQFGGLADMAGISMPGGGGVDIALATLQSRRFIDLFVKEQSGKPIMFTKRWDSEAQAWDDQSKSPVRVLKNLIVPGGGKPRTGLVPGEPTLLETFRRFTEDVISVTKNAETGVVTVRIELEDRYVAAEWANALIDKLNAEIRQGVIDESERAIGYLREQVETTSLAGLQAVMYSLIEEHTKNITLAKANDEYALKIIDPAVVPDESVRPNRRLMVVIGLLAGLMIGGLFAFYRDYVEKKIVQ